jgi:hypothetical protein
MTKLIQTKKKQPLLFTSFIAFMMLCKLTPGCVLELRTASLTATPAPWVLHKYRHMAKLMQTKKSNRSYLSGS